MRSAPSKPPILPHIRARAVLALFAATATLAVLATLAPPVWAGQGSQLLYQIGLNNTINNGDYIDGSLVNGGLQSPIIYRIEVPPGLPQLVVQVFDADISAGANNDLGAANTSVAYRLINPQGVTIFNAVLGAGTGAGLDNLWASFPAIANPLPGHWTLEVDQTINGTSINGYNVRAHDGNAGAGGIELNVYAPSYVPIGIISPTPLVAQVFPLVTSGCVVDTNDWDGDSLGTITLQSRIRQVNAGGGFTASVPVSGATLWNNNPFIGWSAPDQALDYGVWRIDMSLTGVGGGNNNWSDLYVGAWNAADAAGVGPPPSAQPEANTHRIYLPTDAGGAPRKPFLTQNTLLVSGPNPPIAGQTTRVRITIFVTNPSPGPISFSATNLVRTLVPGPAGVVGYAGGLVSQGTITAQPALGGTGAVTWNPGTVAAASAAELDYLVDVTPPPSCPGVPVNLTGTPGAGGTNATWVDETCTGALCSGLQLTRATFATGDLCQLSIDCTLLTYAAASDLLAYRDHGRRVVVWHTATEAGSRRFVLRRIAADGAAVVVGSVEALLDAPQGGRYRLVDRSAPVADDERPVTYELWEIDARSGRRLAGRFTTTVLPRPPLDLPALAGNRERRPRPLRAAPEAGFAKHPARAANDKVATLVRVQVAVTVDGMQRLAAADLAPFFAVDAGVVERWIHSGQLALENRGRPVAWTPSDDATALLFFAQAADSIYTTTNRYALRQAPGLRMPTVDRSTPLPANPEDTFESSLHREQNLFPATALPLDPESDFWFWSAVNITPGSSANSRRSFTVEAPAALAASPATLRVALQSANTQDVLDEHHAQLWLNNSLVGEARWQGIARTIATAAVPPGVLLEGTNLLEVVAVLEPAVESSTFYVDYIELESQRHYRAARDVLQFTGDGHAVIAVHGFASTPLVFDLSNPRLPKRVQVTPEAPQPADFGFRLAPETAQSQYLAASPTAFITPALALDAPSDLHAPGNTAEVLLIAPRGLVASAQALADHRMAQGLRAMVVSLEDVVDEFADGVFTPWAIRDLLRYAHQQWTIAPRYLLLVGAGHWDYQDRLGTGGNLLPPVLASTPNGLFAADNRLGDLDLDGVPEIAVGRLPVASVAELDAVIAKILAYEAADGTGWLDAMLQVADAPDGATDFTEAIDRIGVQVPAHYQRQVIDRGSVPFGAARQDLLARWSAGLAFFDYHGHGAVDRMGGGPGLITKSDVAGLSNGARLPVTTAMTCTLNRFALPGFAALGESLVNAPAGGAIAVWSPSGLSANHDAGRLAEHLYLEMLRGGARRLGDAVLRTLALVSPTSKAQALPSVLTLLGDPSMPLRIAAPAPAITDPSFESGERPAGFTLICDPPGLSIDPGTSVERTCTALAGSTGVTLALRASGGPPGTASVPAPTSITVPAGGSAPFQLTIDADPTAAPASAPLEVIASAPSHASQARILVSVTDPTLIFADGFERGDTTAWNRGETGFVP